MTDEFREMFRNNNYVVLDTETTGLHRPAEVVEIAILDWTGAVLLDTLIRPKLDIPPDAIAIHRITNEMVQTSPTWPEIKPKVLAAIKGRDVLVYNAKYDRHMLHSSDDNWALGPTDYKESANWFCAMEWYAQFFGEWNEYYRSFRWVKLESAAAKFGVETIYAPHRALADADTTLRLCRAVIAELARQELRGKEQPRYPFDIDRR